MRFSLLISLLVLFSSSALAAGVTSSQVYAGSYIQFAGSSCPPGTVAADGSSKLRATYPALFAVIGTTYGSADGTHFTLPDARGMFFRGTGTNAVQALAAGGFPTGAALGSTQQDIYQAHVHSLSGNSILTDGAGASFNLPTSGTGRAYFGGNTASSGGAETRPANLSVTNCIKY